MTCDSSTGRGARLAGWGPGLGEAVERFFEDPDDFSLPPNVELAAFGGVADWLRLELDLGALAALAKRTSRNRRDFAWALRAKTFLRRRKRWDGACRACAS